MATSPLNVCIRLLAVVITILSTGLHNSSNTQVPTPMFGRIVIVRPGKETLRMAAGDADADGTDELIMYGRSHIGVYYRVGDSLQQPPVIVNPMGIIESVQAADCNRDRREDLFVLTREPRQVEIFLAKSNRKFYRTWTIPVSGAWDRLETADLNNDRRTDVVCYGRRDLGAIVYAGRGNGTFSSGMAILTEYSFSNLTAGNIDAATVTDLVGSNWINNTILAFSGFGRLKYGEPTSFTLSGEPPGITLALVNDDNHTDIVTATADRNNLLTFFGDGLGGFKTGQSLDQPGYPYEIITADIDGDSHPDVCTLTREHMSLNVFRNDGTGILKPAGEFHAGKTGSSMTSLRSASGNVDIAILDTARRVVRLMVNAGEHRAFTGEMSFGLGPKPADVTAADINRDGRIDFIVADSQARTISLIIARPDGSFSGPMMYTTTGGTETIRHIGLNDGTSIVVTSKMGEAHASAVAINPSTMDASTWQIPTDESDEILSARVQRETGMLQIYAIDGIRGNGPATIIRFDHSGGTRFIEKTIPLGNRKPVLAATIGDINGDGEADLAYVTRSDTADLTDLRIRERIDAEQGSRARTITSFTGGAEERILLWNTDIDQDGISDFIVNLQGRSPSLRIVYGMRDPLSSPMEFRIDHPIEVRSKYRLKIVDMNGDGRKDILLENILQKSLEVYLCGGDRTFSQRMRIVGSEGMGGFTIVDVDHDGSPELVTTNADEGYLRILTLRETE